METKGELDIHGPQLTLVTLTAKETEDNLAQGRGSVDPWLDSNRSRGAQRWFVDIWWKGEKETWSKSLVFINLFWVLPCLAMAAWVNPCCIELFHTFYAWLLLNVLPQYWKIGSTHCSRQFYIFSVMGQESCELTANSQRETWRKAVEQAVSHILHIFLLLKSSAGDGDLLRS